MITRWDYPIHSEQELSFQMASLFHGAFMEALPEEAATILHQSQLHPYTQHLERRNGQWHWVLTALNDEMGKVMEESLKGKDSFSLKKKEITVQMGTPEIRSVDNSELTDLFYRGSASRIHYIEFITPTAFKRQGQYLFYPDIFCLFQSIMMKYDAIFDSGFHDPESLEELVSHTSIQQYQLRSTTFSLEGVKIPAFLGTIALRIRGTRTMADFANLLLQFGEYSGVGIKTSIGMGAYKLKESFRSNKREVETV